MNHRSSTATVASPTPLDLAGCWCIWRSIKRQLLELRDWPGPLLELVCPLRFHRMVFALRAPGVPAHFILLALSNSAWPGPPGERGLAQDQRATPTRQPPAAPQASDTSDTSPHHTTSALPPPTNKHCNLGTFAGQGAQEHQLLSPFSCCCPSSSSLCQWLARRPFELPHAVFFLPSRRVPPGP